ncbi:30S ribosomal protein S17e [Candidatus Woesearchaeota archaeon]|nr:30S ribosomal protein S17e [Candidatus Woesearchaeota archaeon]
MGRIRSTLIKRTGTNLLNRYPDKFKLDFQHNKQSVTDLADVYSKKLRNVVAGYITHLLKKRSKSKL